MFQLFENTAAGCSKLITQAYSTSFSLGIKTLHSSLRAPIYGIYGVVRYADEIVDTFHAYDKKYLLDKFRRDTYEAIETGISLNPVVYSFAKTVNAYRIPHELIDAFFESMKMDLEQTVYNRNGYEQYIYGSAETVGLMCLKIFVNGNEEAYRQLAPAARALGAAFQKVNFLRDMQSDFMERGRVYFPGIDFANFGEDAKRQIEAEIENDFAMAYRGIMQLPATARTGVLLAYRYYLQLFYRIRRTGAADISQKRIRVPDLQKAWLLAVTLLLKPFNRRSAQLA